MMKTQNSKSFGTFEFLDFGIVSDFELRISDLSPWLGLKAEV